MQIFISFFFIFSFYLDDGILALTQPSGRHAIHGLMLLLWLARFEPQAALKQKLLNNALCTTDTLKPW